MNSYHVFVSPKDDVASAELEQQMKLFLDEQLEDNYLHGYRIIKYSNTANFGEMSDYQIICDYETEDDLKKGFEGMRPERWKKDPHASMVTMVTGLRVSFSSDISITTKSK